MQPKVLFLVLAVFGAPTRPPRRPPRSLLRVSQQRGSSSLSSWSIELKPERNQQHRGLLSSTGRRRVEWVVHAARHEPNAPTSDPMKALNDYSGFGRLPRGTLAQKHMVFIRAARTSPNVSAPSSHGRSNVLTMD